LLRQLPEPYKATRPESKYNSRTKFAILHATNSFCIQLNLHYRYWRAVSNCRSWQVRSAVSRPRAVTRRIAWHVLQEQPKVDIPLIHSRDTAITQPLNLNNLEVSVYQRDPTGHYLRLPSTYHPCVLLLYCMILFRALSYCMIYCNLLQLDRFFNFRVFFIPRSILGPYSVPRHHMSRTPFNPPNYF
jgi:hypothetical protein